MDFLDKAYNYNFEGITNEVYQFRFISMGIQEITKIVSISPIDKNLNWYSVGFGNLENVRGMHGFLSMFYGTVLSLR